ncbi:MAG: PQQ-binding-like beta-propeller repeat protein [Planctomycetales bacterium]|nr:PQQ-binding-like beta-propeller repeat protein [Planctomycetales bacterium]
MRSTSWLLVSLCVICSVCQSAHGENWGQWRGPFFNGTTNETNLPTQWTRTENTAWVAELPGASAATPVVWGDRVFVSSVDAGRDKLVAICIDKKTGSEVWTRDISDTIRKDSRSTFSSPSPVTDGNVVIFFYGNGDLLAYDFDGDEKWRRNIQNDYGQFAFLWTFSTSPVLYDGKLFLQVLQRDVAVDGRGFRDRKNESYLVALDPASGEELWKHIRPSEAKMESREAFTTPMPFEFNGQKQLLVIGGDDLTSHDIDTGQELWRWGTWNPQRITHWRHVPSPIAGDGTVLVCAPKKDPVYAIKLGGTGTLGDEAVAWESSDNRIVSADVPTPAFYDGDFFVLSDVRNTIMRVNPKNGEVVWQARTPGRAKFEASPTVADGKIYTVNFVGDVVIFDAKTGDVINNISMDEASEDAIRSSIVVSDGQLFIRTNAKLYCIGKSS